MAMVTRRDDETRRRGYYDRIVKAQATDPGQSTAVTTKALARFDPDPTWSRF